MNESILDFRSPIGVGDKLWICDWRNKDLIPSPIPMGEG
jgi:hypothetical protein